MYKKEQRERVARLRRAAQPRGVALLLAVIFTAVILAVGLSLADISYKQVILASTATESGHAFYNADSALECALEMDQQYHTFDLGTEPLGTVTAPITCEGVTPTITSTGVQNSVITTTITIPCTSGSNATVTVYKQSVANPYYTSIYANGFNDCNASDPVRVERGIEAHY